MNTYIQKLAAMTGYLAAKPLRRTGLPLRGRRSNPGSRTGRRHNYSSTAGIRELACKQRGSRKDYPAPSSRPAVSEIGAIVVRGKQTPSANQAPSMLEIVPNAAIDVVRGTRVVSRPPLSSHPDQGNSLKALSRNHSRGGSITDQNHDRRSAGRDLARSQPSYCMTSTIATRRRHRHCARQDQCVSGVGRMQSAFFVCRRAADGDTL
jgi:hypothetical protein